MRLLRSSRFALLLPLAALPASCQDGGTPPSETGGQAGAATTEGAPCSFGNDPQKCGSREDIACTLTLVDTEESCDEDDDCDDGQLCFLGEGATATCQSITGTCTALAPPDEGLGFGETCDPGETSDPCAGVCVPIGDDGAGECEQTCRVGAETGCEGGNGDSASVACAFFAYDLSDAGIEQGAGDLGVCAYFCNCNADCPGDQLCLSAPTDDYLGICAGGIQSQDSIEACDGAGGAGGSGP